MNQSIDHIRKSNLLQEIRASRERLEATLDGISDEQLLLPRIQEGWSVKDLLAHITSWEQRMVHWMRIAIAGGVPEEFVPALTWDVIHKINEETYQRNKERPIEEVMAEFQRSYSESYQFLEGVSAQDLEDASRFPWRKGAPLLRMAASNTWWHYDEHNEEISKWLDRNKS